MISAIGSAVAGAQAQTARLDVSAANVANLRTRGALPDAAGAVPEGQPEPPRTLKAVQVQNGGPEIQAAGPRTLVQPAVPGFVQAFEPDNSFANQDGFVAAPSTELVRESVSQIESLRMFQANLATVRAADEAVRSVLDLTA